MPAAIAQIEPLTRTRALRGPFDYRLSDPMRAQVRIGSLLAVPFGRQQLTGVVTGLSDSSELPDDRLLEPLRLLAEGVPSELIELAQWLAREYCSTQARALGLVLPPGITRGMRPKLRAVASLTELGMSVAAGQPPPGTPLGARQIEALQALRAGPLSAARLPGGASTLRRLRERGLVAIRQIESARRPVHVHVGARAGSPPRLNADQQRALELIGGAIGSESHQSLLLHGVTGSGKTEVYLRATDQCLQAGRGVIVLVPEIALTPQITGRFIERFGETVAVLHSRLSPGERYDEWRRLRSGQARICVGPRSAIFAPVEQVGLIVVDEEHDSSYKHESDPRYDARAVAAERARRACALLLYGSATPRAESARLPAARLPRRADGGPMPAVEVLDMRKARHGLHAQTAAALAQVRADGGKAIILLNRRGFSAFLACGQCGEVWGCPDCDVSLVLHAGAGVLACHHCGHRERIPDSCNCGSRSLARHGAGTERIEDLLAQSFCDERFALFRLDGDVLAAAGGDRSASGAAGRVLASFQAADSGVLLGTQMVAKGHDFPGVALGIVLDADATLRFPDFRAEERTFALIAQLAGRIGRGGNGRVLVQTIAPKARAIVSAAAHDSDGFLATELERREALGYPPFRELVRVTCASAEASAAHRAAMALRDRLRPELALGPGRSTSLLGPAALFRLRGQERSALLLKCERKAGAIEALNRALQLVVDSRAHRNVSFSVDVDPH